MFRFENAILICFLFLTDCAGQTIEPTISPTTAPSLSPTFLPTSAPPRAASFDSTTMGVILGGVGSGLLWFAAILKRRRSSSRYAFNVTYDDDDSNVSNVIPLPKSKKRKERKRKKKQFDFFVSYEDDDELELADEKNKPPALRKKKKSRIRNARSYLNQQARTSHTGTFQEMKIPVQGQPQVRESDLSSLLSSFTKTVDNGSVLAEFDVTSTANSNLSYESGLPPLMPASGRRSSIRPSIPRFSDTTTDIPPSIPRDSDAVTDIPPSIPRDSDTTTDIPPSIPRDSESELPSRIFEEGIPITDVDVVTSVENFDGKTVISFGKKMKFRKWRRAKKPSTNSSIIDVDSLSATFSQGSKNGNSYVSHPSSFNSRMVTTLKKPE